MIFTYIDLEYLLIYIILFCCLIPNCKIRLHKIEAKSLSNLAIDITTSDIMKAIACVFVLMGHWATILQNSGEELGIIAKVSWYTTANIALCWFMYFSGYGLSCKDTNNLKVGHDYWQRVKKVYIPLLVVSFCASIVCGCLPNIELENTWPFFNKNVYMLHNIELCYIKPIIMSAFGLFDWYVSCILIFYSIFYLTLYFSRKFKVNHTLLLGIVMLIYNIAAIYVFGWQKAHYFRFPWIFMLGHLVAVYKRNPRTLNILTICVFLPTMFIHGKIMLSCFILAILGIIIFAAISRRYYLRSKSLLFLGSISYFFYLCHQRIGYTLLAYTSVHSMLLWIFITIIISFLLFKLYKWLLTS